MAPMKIELSGACWSLDDGRIDSKDFVTKDAGTFVTASSFLSLYENRGDRFAKLLMGNGRAASPRHVTEHKR